MRLRAGVFGAIRIKTGHIPGVVVVPVPAVQVQEGTQKGFVLVVDGHNIAHQRNVQIGDAFEGKFPVTKGLHPGELVVTVGAYGTPDGTPVRIASAQQENDR
jgi:multidrug efflux pump subunit AcrA (membrane-fusion protein)